MSHKKLIAWVFVAGVVVVLLTVLSSVPVRLLLTVALREKSIIAQAAAASDLFLSSTTTTTTTTTTSCAEEDDDDGNAAMAQRVHQIWHAWSNASEAEGVPEKWKALTRSWQQCYPEAEYKLWNASECRMLIAEHYPWFLRQYDSLRYPVQKVDASRLFILHRFGGIYADADIGCRAPMQHVWRRELVLAQTTPVGFTNAFLVARPGSGFLNHVVAALPHWASRRVIASPYLTVMTSIGPTWLSYQFHLFPNRSSSSSISIINPAMWREFIDLHSGKTWFSWDAKLLQWLISNAALVIPLASISVLGVVAPSCFCRHLLLKNP